MEEFFFSKEVVDLQKEFHQDMLKHPELINDFSWFDMTREEKMENWLERYNRVAAIDRDKYIDNQKYANSATWTHNHLGISTLSMHTSMFKHTIVNLASEK